MLGAADLGIAAIVSLYSTSKSFAAAAEQIQRPRNSRLMISERFVPPKEYSHSWMDHIL